MSQISLKFFCEDLGYDNLEFYTEVAKNGTKDYFIEGIFAQADVINGNRRVYPSKVLMPAVENYIQTRVNRNIAMGELDHPDKLQVSMKHVSHLITELKIEGANVYGKAKLTNTPMGNIAKGLMESGVQLSVSTRGAGKSTKQRKFESMDMYIMTAVDIVSMPSAPDAFVNGVRENLEYMVESSMLSTITADKILKSNMSTAEFRSAVRAIMADFKIV